MYITRVQRAQVPPRASRLGMKGPIHERRPCQVKERRGGNKVLPLGDRGRRELIQQWIDQGKTYMKAQVERDEIDVRANGHNQCH